MCLKDKQLLNNLQESPDWPCEQNQSKMKRHWAGKTWILHHNNPPAHTALSVKHFLASKKITTLNHPLYFPDLAPCDFFLFPKLKGILKGTLFKRVVDIKANVTAYFKSIKKEEFAQYFKGWGQEEWQSVSKSMANTLKGTIRDHTKIVCGTQSGHGMCHRLCF